MVSAAVLALYASGCIRDDRLARDDGQATPFERGAHTIAAPKQNRCTKHGQSSIRGPCDEATWLAQTYVRRLAVGDGVCLEGGFGDKPGAACLTRAAVVDVGPNTVLMEIRSAQPGSRWHDHVMSQVWYEEGALVDLYLSERGY